MRLLYHIRYVSPPVTPTSTRAPATVLGIKSRAHNEI